MLKTQSEIKAIRTVRRKKVKDLLTVLFFLLLLPYTCSVLTTEPDSDAVETLAAASGGRHVLWEKENGVWRIPEEEFLVGVLAGAIPGYYREETLKAQAVILRSVCRAEDDSKHAADNLNAANVSQLQKLSYLDAQARSQLWQEHHAEYEAKFTRAVQSTIGIVLTYEGQIISPPYFRLGTGQTRDSAQIWKEDPFPWCASVSCPHNLESEDYLQTVTVKRDIFLQKMRQEGIKLPDTGVRMALTRDSAGYVLWVECDGQYVEGEQFRTIFELPSASFSIREEGSNLVFTTKGIGHGLGFDQYAADLQAGAGQDYQELLHTFFDGVTLEKVE